MKNLKTRCYQTSLMAAMILVGIGFARPANGADIRVPEDVPTIEEAVEKADKMKAEG